MRFGLASSLVDFAVSVCSAPTATVLGTIKARLTETKRIAIGDNEARDRIIGKPSPLAPEWRTN
jgi:hypothetical protein